MIYRSAEHIVSRTSRVEIKERQKPMGVLMEHDMMYPVLMQGARIEPGPSKDTLLQHLADAALRAAIEGATVVVLPESTAARDGKQAFRHDTNELVAFLRDQAPGDLSIEIASDDEDYAEVVLHGAEIWLPALLFASSQSQLINLTISLIANYIYDHIRGFLTSDVRVHAQFFIDAERNTISLTFDGPADTFERVAKDAMAKINARK